MALSKKVASGFIDIGVNDKRMDSDMQKTKQKATKGFADIGKVVAGIFAGSALTRLVAYGQQMAREAEVAKVAFGVLTGSVEDGLKVFEDLRKFSDVTPFNSKEVQEAGRRLLAAQVQAEDLTEKLTFLGDAAAGSGAKLNEVVAAFAKLRSTGKLTEEIFLMFAERSINLAPALEEILGVSNKELKKMQREGKITTEIVEQAFKRMTKGAGLFSGAMIKLSLTTEGRLSTLFSKLAQIAEVIGKSIKPIVDAMVELGIAATEAFLDLAPAMQNVTGILINMAPAIVALVVGFKALKLAGVSAGMAIRGALIATGIGATIPLVIWLTSEFIKLVNYVRDRGGPAMDKFREAGEKLQRAWEIISDAIQVLLQGIMIAFGILQQHVEVTWQAMFEAAMMWIAIVADWIAEFVLDAVEWFKVLWNNWDVVMDLIADAWEFTWRALVDIMFNTIPFMLAQFIAFSQAIIDIFSAIPASIVTLLSGGSIGDALDVLFAEATAKFAERQKKAFDALFTPSAKTLAVANRLEENFKKLGTEKKKLELERVKIDDDKAEEEEEEEEEKKKEEPAKKDDKTSFGKVGLAEFANELQAMFIESEMDDTGKQTVGILTDSQKVQEDIQQGIVDLNEKQDNAINVKIAEG